VALGKAEVYGKAMDVNDVIGSEGNFYQMVFKNQVFHADG
jgi:hypothetical protein